MHWPNDVKFVNIAGGSTRPGVPPTIFNVPPSCLPTSKPPPRPQKAQFGMQNHFDKNDIFSSFAEFSPRKELLKKYKNILFIHLEQSLICLFTTSDFSQCLAVVIVKDCPTMCCPVTFTGFKKGFTVNVPPTIIKPNNGFNRYSEFFEAVNFVLQYQVPVSLRLAKVAEELEDISRSEELVLDESKKQKVKFLSRQADLLSSKRYDPQDYCFSVSIYPSCKYDHLRQFLVLPEPRKVIAAISSTDCKAVLTKMFQKIRFKQRHSFLLVDEVKVKPTLSFSYGILNGLAQNKPDEKATSMLGIMLRCLHGGPSLMVAIIPVSKLTAEYQFSVVVDTAKMVEDCGGIVIGSITDNHRINQQYCHRFNRQSSCQAIHPLDNSRTWFLLYDTVHLFKCIRNNWLTEKCKHLTLDGENVGQFQDVQMLYEKEKNNILKALPLTLSSVYPSRLQLQNVQHVIKVFNDKVIAALRVENKVHTANFMDQVLSWWNTVNVACKGENLKFNNPNRSVQTRESTSLNTFVQLFTNASSGQGPKRVKSLTHDTKKALIQTTEGLIAVCNFLFGVGFEYVQLREIQSDKIEHEFGVYRKSTGFNSFMVSSDVLSAFQKRLSRFSCKFLESIAIGSTADSSHSHTCTETTFEDSCAIEQLFSVDLTVVDLLTD